MDNVFGKTCIFLSIWRFRASKVDPEKIFFAVGGGGGRNAKERERERVRERDRAEREEKAAKQLKQTG